MFDFLKKRAILEQKKMLWQNLHGSMDMIDILERRKETFNRDPGLHERLQEKLKNINALADRLINKWDYVNQLDKNNLSYVWNDNKVLRSIFAEYIKVYSFETFDEWINPPYGWEVALKGGGWE